MKWQQIETAPKDGSRIMTCYPRFGALTVDVIRWSDLRSEAAMWDALGGGKVVPQRPKWVRDDGSEFPNAMWWLPLPEEFERRNLIINAA